MSFAHPWLLTGAAWGALPLLAHLWFVARPKEVWFAPIALLARDAEPPSFARALRERALLALRLGLIAALAVALSRPVWGEQRPTQVGGGRSQVVLVLDASPSMRAVWQGRSLWQAARERAHQWVDEAPPHTQVQIVSTAQSPQTWATKAWMAAGDGALLHREIEALPGPTALASATLGDALRALGPGAGESLGPTEIVVLGDLSAESLASLPHHEARQERGLVLRCVDVAGRKPLAGGRLPTLPNAAVTAVQMDAAAAQHGPRITVTVCHHAETAMVARAVEVSVGSVRQRGFIDAPASGCVEKVMALDATVRGPQVVSVRLSPSAQDVRADDDFFSGTLEMPHATRVLAIDGDPHRHSQNSELFFAERALEAAFEADAPLDVAVRPRGALLQSLKGQASWDVLLLANVGELTPAEAGAIRVRQQAGLGLVVSLGSHMAGESSPGAEALMGLMPFVLRDRYQAQTPLGGARRGVGVGHIESQHPLLKNLGEAARAALLTSRTRDFVQAQGAEGNNEALVAFATGSPLLLAAPARPGRGAVVLWTTSLDADWSDIALRGVFVPLVQRMVRYAHQAALAAPNSRWALSAQAVRESDYRAAEGAVVGHGAEIGAPAAMHEDQRGMPTDGGASAGPRGARWPLHRMVLWGGWALAVAEGALSRPRRKTA